MLATNFFPNDTLIGQAPPQGEAGGAKTDGYDYVLSEPNECGTSADWANPHSTTTNDPPLPCLLLSLGFPKKAHLQKTCKRE